MSSIPPGDGPEERAEKAEKRSFARYQLWFPVTLDIDGKEVWAICRDASAGGMQVSSIVPLAVGKTVTARFRVSQHTEARRYEVEAEVVRSENNDGELMLAFPFRVGLRFTEPLSQVPADLAAIGVGGGDPTTPIR